MPRMVQDVVVTGAGVLTSTGGGIEEFTDALRKGTCGISLGDEDGQGVGGWIKGFHFEDTLAALDLPESLHLRARKAGRRAPRSGQISIITALEAWQQAFDDADVYLPEDTSILVAGHNINQGYHYGMGEKFRENAEFVPASYALHFMDTDQLGLLSEILDIRGEGFTVGGASASANMGIIQAYRNVKYGLCKACVVVGAMADLSPVEIQAFRNTGAMGGAGYEQQPEKACRPFDAGRNGFIYGQGSACLILESEDSARDRDAHIWGKIEGGAVCLDGNRSSNPSVDGEVRVMRQALENSGHQPEDIDYINAHATGSVLGDEVEVRALKEVFATDVTQIHVNSTKGLTGHCLYAAGIVEAVATMIQMKEGFLHPNLNLDCAIDDECQLIGLTAQEVNCHLALSNAFGFGGINTSIVLSKK